MRSDFAIISNQFKKIKPLSWLNSIAFLSGFAALIYEVIWIRIFSNIFGSTALAMSCVFSVFLMSLAIGAYISGKIANKIKIDLLIVYGIVETLIGISALAVCHILFVNKIAIAIALPITDSITFKIGLQVITTFIFIGIPTLLMGATFPILVSASKKWEKVERSAPALYGWNTLGGAMGAFACGFILILNFGLNGTVLLAFLINLFVALVSIFCVYIKENTSISKEKSHDEQSTPMRWSSSYLVLLILVFISGFTGLALENLWGRLAKFFLGDRTLATSTLLSIYLACLGAGSFLASSLNQLKDKKPGFSFWNLLSWIFAASGIFTLIFVLISCRVILNSLTQEWIPAQLISLIRFFIAFGLMALPVIVGGIIFPLILINARELQSKTALTVGFIYFVNTIGAVFGSLCAGYIISRTIGTLNGVILICFVQIIISILLMYSNRQTILLKYFQMVALIGIFLIIANFYPLTVMPLSPREQMIAYNEDEYGFQKINRTDSGLINVQNNRLQLIYYLGVRDTSIVQQMQAHFPMLFVNDAKHVLNIGTGYGITAGTFTLYPRVESIETIEIIPFLARQQHIFQRYNFKYYDDPRVKIIVDDGRHYLTATKTEYDVISVNVLDPYLPGSSDLFTIDFWKEVKKQLKPNGVMVQLIWGKDKDMLLRGLREVFPQFLIIPAYHQSFNIIAFNSSSPEAIKLHLSQLSDKAKQALAELNINDPENYFNDVYTISQMITERILRDLDFSSNKNKIHSDNYPVLEYQWAAGTSSLFDSPSNIGHSSQ